MPWMEIEHPCQLPSMFEIANKQAGPNSIWQCPDDVCQKFWKLGPDNTWTISYWHKIKLEQESLNAEVESGDESKARAGEASSVSGN